MPTTYTTADNEAMSVLDAAMRAYRPEFVAAGVKVGLLFAENPDGPAVKHDGHAANAKIRVVSKTDRETKPYHAEMIVDAMRWASFGLEERMALLHHELCHITTVPEKKQGKKSKKARPEADQPTTDDTAPPAIKRDDKGRPILKSVPADFNAGDGFYEVIREHGEQAIELFNISHCYKLAMRAKGKEQTQDHG